MNVDLKTAVTSVAAAIAGRRPCLDGVAIGDEVYSTRHLEQDVLWLIGTVIAIESTDLLEVAWHTQAVNPFDAEKRWSVVGEQHTQWHDRAGVAHTHCRGENPQPLGREFMRPPTH
jgi:hypothetical protein